MASQPLGMATEPYQPLNRSMYQAVSQYARLVRVMLAEYRTNWFILVIFGALMPLGMIFLFKSSGTDISGERAIYLLGGNLTTSVVFGPTSVLINKIGWGRDAKVFDYWASLPVTKLAFILSVITVAVLFAFPGLALVFVFGSLFLGVPLVHGLFLIPLVVLGALSLAGLGAFLGTFAKDGQTAVQYTNMLVAFIVFLSPMMIPWDEMPTLLRWVAYIVPTTYVAEAFRAVLSGRFGPDLALNVLIVVVYTCVFMVLVQRKLDWRTS